MAAADFNSVGLILQILEPIPSYRKMLPVLPILLFWSLPHRATIWTEVSRDIAIVVSCDKDLMCVRECFDPVQVGDGFGGGFGVFGGLQHVACVDGDVPIGDSGGGQGAGVRV